MIRPQRREWNPPETTTVLVCSNIDSLRMRSSWYCFRYKEKLDFVSVLLLINKLTLVLILFYLFYKSWAFITSFLVPRYVTVDFIMKNYWWMILCRILLREEYHTESKNIKNVLHPRFGYKQSICHFPLHGFILVLGKGTFISFRYFLYLFSEYRFLGPGSLLLLQVYRNLLLGNKFSIIKPSMYCHYYQQ